MLDKTTKFILLYDFYQDLLTDKQKKFTELYFEDNLSLGEIAEEFDISRQAVYEHIKRSEKLLEEYENKLHLLHRYNKRNEILADMEKILLNDNEMNNTELRKKIALLKLID